MSRRPEFIPQHLFRAWLGNAELNRLFLVDGMKPTSFIAKCAQGGRPIETLAVPHDRYGRVTKHKPLNIVARAWAENRLITMSKGESLTKEISEIEKKRDKMLAVFAHEIQNIEHSVAVTGKRLLTHCEIVAKSKEYEPHCGVYFLCDSRRVLYVGQSVNIYSRVQTHLLSKDFTHLTYTLCKKEGLDFLESLYIHFLRPPMNHSKAGGRWSAPMSLEKIVEFSASQGAQA